MLAGKYTKQPVNRVGADYDGALVQPILREMDEELRRLRSEIASITGLGTSGGGFAPTSEPYVTMASSANLSAERVLTGSTRVSVTDNGPNSTAVLDAIMTSTDWDFLRGVTIYGTSDEIQLDLMPLAGQTQPVFRIRDSGGNALINVVASGQLQFTTTAGATPLRIAGGSPATSPRTFVGAANTSGDAQWFAIAAADLPGSFSGFASPTASVGLSVVAGTATTAMRSDAAPALDQGIIPTWTGLHTFATSGGPRIADGAGNFATLSAASLGADRVATVPSATGVLTCWATGGGGAQPAAGALLYGAGTNSAMTALTIGAAGQIVRSTGTAPGWADPNALATRIQHSWTANGPYIVDTSVDGGWVVPTACTITAIYLYRVTAGSSGSTILDINKNGTTLYSTQANRPTILSSDSDNLIQATMPDIVALAAGDVVAVDTDQIEGGVPAGWKLTLEAS